MDLANAVRAVCPMNLRVVRHNRRGSEADKRALRRTRGYGLPMEPLRSRLARSVRRSLFLLAPLTCCAWANARAASSEPFSIAPTPTWVERVDAAGNGAADTAALSAGGGRAGLAYVLLDEQV